MAAEGAFLYQVVSNLAWDFMCVAEMDDGGAFLVLGFYDDWWRVAARDARGRPLDVWDGECEVAICRGVLGDGEIEDEGDGLVVATVPVDGGGVDYVTEDWCSSDGGATWRRFTP